MVLSLSDQIYAEGCLQEHMADTEQPETRSSSCCATRLCQALPHLAVKTPSSATNLACDWHHLLEHDSCLQEVAVLLRRLQVWVVLQAANHAHHMLLLQQLIQQLQASRKACNKQEKRSSAESVRSTVHDKGTTGNRAGNRFCRQSMSFLQAAANSCLQLLAGRSWATTGCWILANCFQPQLNATRVQHFQKRACFHWVHCL
jgi:hypothetical protein